MKIAVISDIHSNITALESVLLDIEDQKVDCIYCTGDLVGYAPFPNEVIELIRQKQIPSVMGNYDDAVGYMRFICGCDYKDEKSQALGEASILWTKENTLEQNKEFLRSLPEEIRFDINGTSVVLVHGSPERLNEYLFEDTPGEHMSELLEKAQADVLICGHTHKPFHKIIGNKHVINAGSVGKPKHGDPKAAYVIVEFNNEVKVEIMMVQYDYQKLATAIEESGLPDEFANMIRNGVG